MNSKATVRKGFLYWTFCTQQTELGLLDFFCTLKDLQGTEEIANLKQLKWTHLIKVPFCSTVSLSIYLGRKKKRYWIRIVRKICNFLFYLAKIHTVDLFSWIPIWTSLKLQLEILYYKLLLSLLLSETVGVKGEQQDAHSYAIFGRPPARGLVCTSEGVCAGCWASPASCFHHPHSSWWQQAGASGFLLQLCSCPCCRMSKMFACHTKGTWYPEKCWDCSSEMPVFSECEFHLWFCGTSW